MPEMYQVHLIIATVRELGKQTVFGSIRHFFCVCVIEVLHLRRARKSNAYYEPLDKVGVCFWSICLDETPIHRVAATHRISRTPLK